MSAWNAAAAFSETSHPAIVAPPRAKRRAVARPMPAAAPVMRMILPEKLWSSMIYLLLWQPADTLPPFCEGILHVNLLLTRLLNVHISLTQLLHRVIICSMNSPICLRGVKARLIINSQRATLLSYGRRLRSRDFGKSRSVVAPR